MKVSITKDAQGQFSVSVESEAPTQPGAASLAQGLSADSGGQSAPAAPEASATANAQPAASLEEALNMAGRLLSQPEPGAGPSPFDQGVAAVLPKKPGMM